MIHEAFFLPLKKYFVRQSFNFLHAGILGNYVICQLCKKTPPTKIDAKGNYVIDEKYKRFLNIETKVINRNTKLTTRDGNNSFELLRTLKSSESFRLCFQYFRQSNVSENYTNDDYKFLRKEIITKRIYIILL